MPLFVVCVYLFPSCCFVPEPTYQDHLNSCLVQKEVEASDSKRTERLIPYPDPYQLHQYVDRKELLLAQVQEDNTEMDREICSRILLASSTSPKTETRPLSPECRLLVPSQALLPECEGRLVVSHEFHNSTKGTPLLHDLLPEKKLAYKE